MPSQLPHFIQEHLIHSSDLHLSRKCRSTLALANLNFYEVNNKQVLNSIDLRNTILSKVQTKLESIVPELNGFRSQESDMLGSSIACPNYSVGEIMIGKYIYHSGDFKNVYILLKCWNLLVVIRKDLEGFTLQAEYEEVRSFEVRKGNSYQVQLAISFLNHDHDIVADFKENHTPTAVIPKADAYKKMLDRIKMKRSELLVHKTITKKEFSKLKIIDLFGSNFLRTPRLEEMQVLSKCGNAWIKVTANDDIVIGVPLINNCSSRLTILRNFRAVLHGSSDLNYKFNLYQLKRKLSDLENVQGFFESQTENDINTCSWSECTDFSLRPETFCLLILRLKINETFQFDAVKLPLFAFYEIMLSKRAFYQKCFLTNLSFQEIFTKESCRVNFHERHLHRDMLTVIATSYETGALIKYNSNSAIFEDYLCSKMSFFRVLPNRSYSESMNVDEQDEIADFTLDKIFFYNKNQDSLWHGTLFVTEHISDSWSEVKLYTKTQEKSSLFFRLLHTELRIKCNIKDIVRNPRNVSTKLIEFETALRDECYSLLELCSVTIMKKDKLNISRKQKKLYSNELRTDILFNDLKL